MRVRSNIRMDPTGVSGAVLAGVTPVADTPAGHPAR